MGHVALHEHCKQSLGVVPRGAETGGDVLFILNQSEKCQLTLK